MILLLMLIKLLELWFYFEKISLTSSHLNLVFGGKKKGLSEVKNSLIGDAVKRGISGGQRKRVNIVSF